MHEVVANLHMHTPYSDGRYTHARIARAAIQTGLDAVLVTDHNVYVDGLERVYTDGARRALLLVGEEIHDQGRLPQKNHLLVFGAGRELAAQAHDPQRLLDNVRQAGGLSFLAHPYELAAPAVGEPDISWVDWDVHGYTGLELWNGFSEFKSLLKSKLHALFYAFNPRLIARAPHPEALRKWDELLSQGRRVVAVGGSDAHALPASLGPLRKTLFPYEYHFRAINNHLFLESPLSGDIIGDRPRLLTALGSGRLFIGYDLPASTRGFRFTAQGSERVAWMGETIPAKGGVTLQIRLPLPVECRLVKDGKTIKVWHKRHTCTYITTQPGAYRAEAYIHYLGRKRGWIFSNPIYVKGE
ncbi:MAG: CehA/McbA family metallohydrolase [Anaerolineales bacterium]|nr:CehA/McbA family metallohydrolase [Anaerolineales bacterium]